MKQSDIEGFKAIAYALVGIFAYSEGIQWPAITLWILAFISPMAGCIMAYYEQKIKKLKRKPGQSLKEGK
ncbi:hypothetical protein ES703_107646 [subsurface metagenome]